MNNPIQQLRYSFSVGRRIENHVALPVNGRSLSQDPGTSNRVGWVDCAKGLSIILVVLYHVVQGLNGSHLLSMTHGYEIFDATLRRVRMPLFFFASGLFIERATKRQPRRYFADRLGSIVYPYFVWSTLQLAFQMEFSAYTNHKLVFLQTVERLLWAAPMQYWFLYVLFLDTTLWYLLRRAGLSVRILTTVAAFLYFANNFHPWGWWLHAAQVQDSLVFLGLGALVSVRLVELKSPPRPMLAAIVLLGGSVVVCSTLLFADAHFRVIRFVGSVAGVAAMVGLSHLMWRAWLGGFVRLCGKYSLQIFVLHTMAAATWRVTLFREMRVSSPFIHTITGLVVGISLPLVIAGVTERLGLNWIFRLRSAARAPSAHIRTFEELA